MRPYTMRYALILQVSRTPVSPPPLLRLSCFCALFNNRFPRATKLPTILSLKNVADSDCEVGMAVETPDELRGTTAPTLLSFACLLSLVLCRSVHRPRSFGWHSTRLELALSAKRTDVIDLWSATTVSAAMVRRRSDEMRFVWRQQHPF